MSGRPEILFPLFAGLETLEGIGPKTARHFEQLDIAKPRDLLFTLPYSGIDRRKVKTVAGIIPGSTVTVEVEVGAHHPASSRGRPYRVSVNDGSVEFFLIFFHAHGDYLHKQLPTGERRLLSGKVEMFDGVIQISHPDYILLPSQAADIPAYEPVYALTSGVSQKLIARAVAGALARIPALEEWIDPALKARENWPDWGDAIVSAHAPHDVADLSPDTLIRQRLAYDELFAHQLTLALARVAGRRKSGISTIGTGELQAMVRAALPFQPTGAQDHAVEEITADMAAPVRMNRLLQGDVGSGKTFVALCALLNVVEAGGQGVMMAPTEILARQHLEGLRPLAETAGAVMEILTGRDKGAERRAKLAALAAGDIQILLGTHAVFQDDVIFNDLRLAIVDEQHRFGVRQRMSLSRKGHAVDVLVMTATPIPRSLALAQYGDMDVSVLDEKPPGRTPVKTALVATSRLGEVVDHLGDAIQAGRQAYWVCPLVGESELVDLTAAEARFTQLRAQLGEGLVGLVHGQMPPAEKDEAMARFISGETRVLVATTVIEVGVDVPNASIMVIERAEFFGLSQLHQLRGRVGRGSEESNCLMLYQAPLTKSAHRRLKTLRDTEDGFVIAEEDLAMRGAGDVIGTAQSGLPRFRVADLEHQAGLMALAQSDARKLLHDDPTLDSVQGRAARHLLWLMEQEKAIGLIAIG